ncbi:MAG: lysozyme, partial [Caulobacteraceae bacterium]
AEALLAWDLIAVAAAINEWIHAPLIQNQFDALASFAFNIGLENFRRSTTVRRLNEGRMLEAAAAMELWRRADFEGERIVVDALVRRRASEKLLFLKPDAPWPVAPSPLLPPKIDFEAAALLPSATPVALRARLDGDRATAERDHADPDGPPRFHESLSPSAAEIAAASVAHRLERLLPEAGGAESPRNIEPVTGPDSDLEADAEPGAANLASTGPASQSAGARLRESRRALAPRSRQAASLGIFLAGLVGVVLFFAAVRWGFQAQTATPSPIAGDAWGWGLGLAGVALFVFAVWGLLSGLGRPRRGTPEA